jgi:ketosteroid isomerase-like protein
MPCCSLARKKYSTVNLVAWPLARLAVPLLALALAVSPAFGGELQDIDRLVKQGQHAQALERVNRYLAQNPSDAQGRFKKGLILAEQNKVAEAIEVFTKLSQDYPKLPEPHNNLAVLYASEGQYEKARQQLEMSIRTDPRFATAYENLGDVYTKLASQAYDKALQLDSSNSAAKNKLSLIRDLLITSEPRLPAVSIAPAGKTAEPARPPAVATAPQKSAAEAKPAPGQTKPAAAKPAAKQPARTREGNTEEVLQAVRAWAGAWSKQDVDAYLAFYAKDFKTPKSETRAAWEAARKQRISSPKKIEVAVESPKVTLKGDSAVVTFRQAYRSDSLKISGSKTLHMVRSDGRWLIQEERAGG